MADAPKDFWKKTEQQGRAWAEFFQSMTRRQLALTIVLGVVLLVVLTAAYRDGTGFDVLRRHMVYGSTENAGGQVLYEYDASARNRFIALGNHLAVLSDTSFEVLNTDGNAVWATPVKMTTPALVHGGKRLVAYDVGGTDLHVLDKGGEDQRIKTAPEEPLVSVTVNEKGWIAVTTEKKSRKGQVLVYDRNMTEVFAFKSSTRFVMDAWVTDDCKSLAVVTLGQESGVFVSNIVLYNLDQEDPAADYSVSDGLVLEIGQIGRKLMTISDTELTFASTKGKVEESYSYQGEFLRKYATKSDRFVGLLLNRYQSGSVGRLVTVSPGGREIASLEINKEVQSMSAAGRYLAVLYRDSLVVYNRNLEVYATLQGISDAREVIVREDGSALLLSGEEARLFLP